MSNINKSRNIIKLPGYTPSVITTGSLHQQIEVTPFTPFRIVPLYKSFDDSGLFNTVNQEWWDFYYYETDTILENSTAKIAKNALNIATSPYTICMRFANVQLTSFKQLIKPVPRSTQIDCWQSDTTFGSLNIAVSRQGTTEFSTSAAGAASPNYAFGTSVYVIYSFDGTTTRRIFTGTSVGSNAGGQYSTDKAIFDGWSGVPPGSHGAFANLTNTNIRMGAEAITQSWHYWNQAFNNAELEELAQWLDDGNEVVLPD